MPDFVADQAAGLPAARRRHRGGAICRHRPVHHAGRRQGLAVRAGRAGRRPAAGALRAAGIAGAATCSTASSATRSRRAHRGTPRTRTNPSGDEPGSQVFPYVVDDLPADRAPHRRRDVAAPCPTSRSCSRRSSARSHPSWRPSADSSTAAGRPSSRARSAIEARVLVTERLHAAARRRPAVHQVGLPYHWGSNGYSTGDAANDLVAPVPGPERPHPGGQGAGLRHPARPAAARTRAAGARRASTGERAGITERDRDGAVR